MKESRVRFFAGCAGGFGFYFAWQCLSLFWLTTTPDVTAMKAVIGLILGLVVGVLLYLGVYFLANKKLEATISKYLTRYTIFGIVAGLVIGYLFGLLLNNLGFYSLS